MSTTAVAKPQSSVAAGKHDRLFYSAMAIAMAIIVFIGFAPTFYLRKLFGAPVSVTGATTLSVVAVMHGILFTAWVVLFIVQTALVASHRVALHRKLGITGGALAALMFVVGIVTAARAAARGAAPPGGDPLAFLVIPFFDVTLFAVFVALALIKRADKEMHKRCMLLGYISILAAGVARLPGVLPLGPFGFYGLTFIFILIGIAYDWASRRRIHPVYLWGGALLVTSVPLRLMLSETAAWHAFAEMLARI